MTPRSSHAALLAVVRRIPRGRVATHGQVAALAGLPGQARLAGYALAALDAESVVPWHRVVNARGEISPRRADAAGGLAQRIRLEREGVAFDARGRIPLDRFGWTPRRHDRAPRAGAGAGTRSPARPD